MAVAVASVDKNCSKVDNTIILHELFPERRTSAELIPRIDWLQSYKMGSWHGAQHSSDS